MTAANQARVQSHPLAPPDRIVELAWPLFANHLPPHDRAPEPIKNWFIQFLSVFATTVDSLDQLPSASAFVFGFDQEAARACEENRDILAANSTRIVLTEFGERVSAHAGHIDADDFNRWLGEIEHATGVEGDDLLAPIRIALTGSHACPEFDKLVPLLEQPAARDLNIPAIRERVARFVGF